MLIFRLRKVVNDTPNLTTVECDPTILTNPKPTIYRTLYENTGPGDEGNIDRDITSKAGY